MRLQAVPVHPLSQRLGGVPCCSEAGATGDAFEAVDLAAAGELYPSGARDRIDGQAMDRGAVATDGEAHWLVV